MRKLCSHWLIQNGLSVLLMVSLSACIGQTQSKKQVLVQSPALASGFEVILNNRDNPKAPGSVANGQACNIPADCQSNHCSVGPESIRYCIAPEKNCVKPEADGVMWSESYVSGNRAYVCESGVGLKDLGPAILVQGTNRVEVDSPAIQKALNEVPEGGVVALNPGSYAINCLRIKNKKGITFLGLKNQSERAVLQIVGDAVNIDLKDPWVFDTNRVSPWPNSRADGKVDWVANIGDIDEIIRSTSNRIEKKSIYQSECGADDSPNLVLQAGIRLEGTIDSVEIRGLKIVGDGKPRPRGHAGIYNNSGVTLNKIRIIDNVIVKLVNAIALGGADPNRPVTDILIEGNDVQDVVGILAGTGYGIQVEQYPSYDGDIKIIGNKVARAQRHSIYLGRARKVKIENNEIIDHRKNAPSPEGATWLSAIAIARSRDVEVLNNRVNGFKDGALELSGVEHDRESSNGVQESQIVRGSLIGNYRAIGNQFTGQLLEDTSNPPPPAVLIGTSDPTREFPPNQVVLSQNTFDLDVYSGVVQVQDALGLTIEGNVFHVREAPTSFSATASVVKIYGLGEQTGTSVYSRDFVFRGNEVKFYPQSVSKVDKVNLFYCPVSNAGKTRACQDSGVNMLFDSNRIGVASGSTTQAIFKNFAIDPEARLTNPNVVFMNETPSESVAIANGQVCQSSGQCESGYCYPGPENKNYCIAAIKNCAKPGTDGIFWNESFIFNQAQYTCVSGRGLVSP